MWMLVGTRLGLTSVDGGGGFGAYIENEINHLWWKNIKIKFPVMPINTKGFT